ncbi:LacI family transcriptional regulator [Alteromonadaceae bacterium M269]|nr:LacI family transcriptional regulator [Alteromonadaceae bacterium M269]
MKKKKLMTLSDISKISGVSESTVSRALSGSKLVSDKTRAKIQAIADEHNFTINAAARNLRLQKTKTVAVIILISSGNDQSVSDPFMLSLVGSIAEALGSKGYDMLLSTTRSAPQDWQRHYFDTRKADGLIIIGQGEDDAPLNVLVDSTYPFVTWGSTAKSYTGVGSDNRKGGYLATRHLIDQGCRRIGFFGKAHHAEIHERWQGYKQALEENEAAAMIDTTLDVPFTAQAGYKVAKQLINDNSFTYDGIVAASDMIAIGIIKALKESAINVPKDVAVVGFDDISLASMYHPSLTTVRQDTVHGGEMLVSKLLAKLNGEEVQSETLPTQLVIRQSTQRSK